MQYDNVNHSTDVIYLYYDFGAGHFTDFEFLFTVQCDFNVNYIYNYVGLSDIFGTFFTDIVGGGHDFFGIRIYKSWNGVDQLLRFLEYADGVGNWMGAYDCDTNPKYLKMKRVGTTATLYIYSDAARTVLLDTLTDTCDAQTFRYVLPFLSDEQAGTATPSDGYHEDFDLQDTPAPTGDKNIPTYFNSKFITHH